MLIKTVQLNKVYKINVKEPGLKGTLKNLIHSQWREKKAIEDVSFEMHRGQMMACIGENGAGKSTLIKMLIGILTPSSGDVQVYGKNPRHRSKEYLRKIGVIFGQKSNLWTDIPVIESYQAVKTLYKVDEKVFQKNYDMVVELLELSEILSSPARKLSLGQRMKADIGMVFLHSPEILFLDEPTIGLDINVKKTIRGFIRQMNSENGVSVFLTSHDLDDIDEICDDVIVLSHGKMFYDGSLFELKNEYVKEKKILVVGKEKKSLQSLLPDVRVSKDGTKIKIEYSIERYSAEEVVQSISMAFDIDDITIQDPGIDDIVSQIFSQEAK